MVRTFCVLVAENPIRFEAEFYLSFLRFLVGFLEVYPLSPAISEIVRSSLVSSTLGVWLNCSEKFILVCLPSLFVWCSSISSANRFPPRAIP